MILRHFSVSIHTAGFPMRFSLPLRAKATGGGCQKTKQKKITKKKRKIRNPVRWKSEGESAILKKRWMVHTSRAVTWHPVTTQKNHPLFPVSHNSLPVYNTKKRKRNSVTNLHLKITGLYMMTIMILHVQRGFVKKK